MTQGVFDFQYEVEKRNGGMTGAQSCQIPVFETDRGTYMQRDTL